MWKPAKEDMKLLKKRRLRAKNNLFQLSQRTGIRESYLRLRWWISLQTGLRIDEILQVIWRQKGILIWIRSSKRQSLRNVDYLNKISKALLRGHTSQILLSAILANGQFLVLIVTGQYQLNVWILILSKLIKPEQRDLFFELQKKT